MLADVDVAGSGGQEEFFKELPIAARENLSKVGVSGLFVARSTLLNRLRRIRELTGIDLDDPDERLYLAISFALRELEARLGTAARESAGGLVR